jgi:hypothetical protein
LTYCVKENLLRPIGVYNDEFIYAISDEGLDGFLQDCLEVYEFISGVILDIWTSIRRPSPQEIRWLEFFIGKESTAQIVIKAHDRRKSKHDMTINEFFEWQKWWKSVLEESEADAAKMVMYLKKKHQLTIQKYPYPSNDVLELVYPKFLKETFQITDNR